MDCPYCGKEMRAGRIPSQNHLKWYDSAGEWGAGIRLSETFQEVQAFYCPDCRRIVIPVPVVEGMWDKMQQKLGAASEKLSAMRERFEERRTQADQTKRQNEKEKRGKRDPWEL